MSTEGAGISYRSTEKPFIDYFNRLKAIGMTYDEIRLTTTRRLLFRYGNQGCNLLQHPNT